MAIGTYSGFGELMLSTTDLPFVSGAENGGFFPRINGFNLTREVETTEKFGFEICGSGTRKKLASFTAQTSWNGTFTMPVWSWLDLQLAMGYAAADESVTSWEVKCATVASNIITDADLNGLTDAQIRVTHPDYAVTAGDAGVFEIVAAAPTGLQVDFDNVANTLTFETGVYNGRTIFYAIQKTRNVPTIGGANSTALNAFSFYGLVNVSNGGSANGHIIWIPSLTIDGTVSLSVTGDDEIEVAFTPVLVSPNKEEVIIQNP